MPNSWEENIKMSSEGDAKTTVQNIPTDDNLIMTQEQSAKKGKIMQKNVFVVKAGIHVTLFSFVLLYIFLLPPIHC